DVAAAYTDGAPNGTPTNAAAACNDVISWRRTCPARSCTIAVASTRTHSSSPNTGVPKPRGAGRRPMCDVAPKYAAATTCSATACNDCSVASYRGGRAGSVIAHAPTSEPRREDARELERLVALNAVAGVFDDFDLGARIPLLQLGDVGVVDHRRQTSA